MKFHTIKMNLPLFDAIAKDFPPEPVKTVADFASGLRVVVSNALPDDHIAFVGSGGSSIVNLKTGAKLDFDRFGNLK